MTDAQLLAVSMAVFKCMADAQALPQPKDGGVMQLSMRGYIEPIIDAMLETARREAVAEYIAKGSGKN